MNVVDVVATVVGLAAVFSAVAAARSHHLVHAALWFALTLAEVAVLMGMAGAPVVAVLLVLIYVGAVVVLMVFAIMVTRSPLAWHQDLTAPQRRFAAAILAGTVTGILGGAVTVALGSQRAATGDYGSPTSVGTGLFTQWALPFELVSLVLVAALVAALWLVGPGRTSPVPLDRAPDDTPDDAGAGASVNPATALDLPGPVS